MRSTVSDILQSFAEGKYSQQRAEDAIFNTVNDQFGSSLTKVVILEVILDPTNISEETKSHYIHNLGVSNAKYINVLPRNTVIAKKLLDSSNESEQSMFLFPFFPSHIAMPCKVGEHVWAFIEQSNGKEIDVGWWMWRVVTFNHTDDVNHSHQPRNFDNVFFKSTSSKALSDGTTNPTYDFFNGVGNKTQDGTRYPVASSRCIAGGANVYEQLLINSNASKITTYESVPRYNKRPDEQCFEGSNNTLICLGTDRINKNCILSNSGENGQIAERPKGEIIGPGTGKIDLVVGRGQTTSTSGVTVENSLKRKELAKSQNEVRVGEGDIDYINDRSRILIAGKTLVDVNFQLDNFNSSTFTEEKIEDRGKNETELKSEKCGDGAVAIKSDKIRLISRSDIVLYVTSFERDDNGNMIENDDISKWAAIAIRSNGDIVFKPGEKGVIKLNGDDSQFGIVASNVPCNVDRTTGKVSGAPIISTMGGSISTAVTGQGSYADRILV